MSSHDAPGMRGDRSRNEDGELRRKRGDTDVGTIEDKYGWTFVALDVHAATTVAAGKMRDGFAGAR